MTKTVGPPNSFSFTVNAMDEQVKALMGKPWDYVFRWDESINGYFVRVLELDGCYSQGETLEEGYAMIRDAMKMWLEVAIEKGVPIPETNHDKLLRNWESLP